MQAVRSNTLAYGATLYDRLLDLHPRLGGPDDVTDSRASIGNIFGTGHVPTKINFPLVLQRQIAMLNDGILTGVDDAVALPLVRQKRSSAVTPRMNSVITASPAVAEEHFWGASVFDRMSAAWQRKKAQLTTEVRSGFSRVMEQASSFKRSLTPVFTGTKSALLQGRSYIVEKMSTGMHSLSADVGKVWSTFGERVSTIARSSAPSPTRSVRHTFSDRTFTYCAMAAAFAMGIVATNIYNDSPRQTDVHSLRPDSSLLAPTRTSTAHQTPSVSMSSTVIEAHASSKIVEVIKGRRHLASAIHSFLHRPLVRARFPYQHGRAERVASSLYTNDANLHRLVRVLMPSGGDYTLSIDQGTGKITLEAVAIPNGQNLLHQPVVASISLH